jgi:hypothetical protein
VIAEKNLPLNGDMCGNRLQLYGYSMAMGDDLVAMSDDLMAMGDDLVAMGDDLVAMGDDLVAI